MRTILAVLLLLPIAAYAQPRPDPTKTELDQLLTALAQSPSEDVAGRLEARIAQLWQKSGGPTAALLLNRGARNLGSGDATEAVADFTAVLALEPDLPEAFGRRAQARFQAGDIQGAIHDLEETLRREPRHFGAWRTLSLIGEEQGRPANALQAWKKLLEVDPKTPGGATRLKQLTRLVEGEAS